MPNKFNGDFEKGENNVILLIGNPNVGKSLIFRHLTGEYAQVSNYPGTTVEITYGKLKVKNREYLVIDAPGIKSFFSSTDDEKVTLNLLIRERPKVAILVADAKNLKRSLPLLYEMKILEIPTVLVLNMWDELKVRGYDLNHKKLEELLNVPCIPTIAIHGWGIKNILNAIEKAKIPKIDSPPLNSEFSDILETIKEKINLKITSLGVEGLAILFVFQDSVVEDYLREKLEKEDYKDLVKTRDKLIKTGGGNFVVDFFSEINKISDRIVSVLNKSPYSGRQRKFDLDKILLNPVFGYVFVLLVMFLMYLFVGQFGAGILVDFLENKVLGNIINLHLSRFFDSLTFLPVKLKEFFVGEFGLFTMAITYSVAIILPIVFTFFLSFGILEDSGYLPRMAFLLDRFLRMIGLTGKAVLPMVLGLGCVTMATITTRILETKKEKLLATLLLALGVPCSAQLGVVMALISGYGLKPLLFWLTFVSANLLIVGYLSSKVIPGERSYFVLEIPPLRRPSLSNLYLKTYIRMKWYLMEVVPVFILATAFLFFLDLFKILHYIEIILSPLVQNLLGLPKEAAMGFVMGFLRRDYGAAGFYHLHEKGLLSVDQIIVSIITITLFVPCIANFLVMIKERGLRPSILILFFIIPYAFFQGYLVRVILSW